MGSFIGYRVIKKEILTAIMTAIRNNSNGERVPYSKPSDFPDLISKCGKQPLIDIISGTKDMLTENDLYGVTHIKIANFPTISRIYCPESVTEIDKYALNSMTLVYIDLSKTSVNISESFFEGFQELASVALPKTLNSIATWTFKNCVHLQEITIPENVTQISYQAFYGCPLLTTVYLECSSVPTVGAEVFPYSTKIYVNKDIYDDIIVNESWAPYVSQIKIKSTEEGGSDV